MAQEITSLVLDGRPIAVIDNIEGVLRSPHYALLTSTTWSDRILGRSGMVERPHRICWMATGNNIRLAETPRQCYKVRLDAKHSRPWQRNVQGFKHRSYYSGEITKPVAGSNIYPGKPGFKQEARTNKDVPDIGSLRSGAALAESLDIWNS